VCKVANDHRAGSGNLGVAFQAEIVITLGEHLVVDRTMHVVATRATISQCLMLKDTRTGLLAMTLSAGLILATDKHSFRVVDVLAVRVVATGAAHSTFPDRVAVLETEQCLCL
jgi:hypothetical protein